MHALEKHCLDARELAHPKPLKEAMKILRKLNHTNYLHMIHRKNPVPLLDLAKEQNFFNYSKEVQADEWHIIISCTTPQVDIAELIRV